jgi:hypothetical protein
MLFYTDGFNLLCDLAGNPRVSTAVAYENQAKLVTSFRAHHLILRAADVHLTLPYTTIFNNIPGSTNPIPNA